METAVATSTELSALALRHGRAKKRNNAVVAGLSGALPGVILTFYLPVGWERSLIGLIIGLVWANAFEYAYHRWLLHRPRSSLGRGHLEHHANIGTPMGHHEIPNIRYNVFLPMFDFLFGNIGLR